MIQFYSNGFFIKALTIFPLTLAMAACGGSDPVIDNPPPSVNHTPTISAVSFSVDEDSQLQGIIIATDQDGDKLSYSLTSDVSNGVLSFSNDGSFVYQPTDHFYGEDGFTASVSDGTLSSNTATFTIQVNAINNAPTISVASKITRLDHSITFSLNINDIENEELTVSLSELPEKGVAVINADNTMTYTPDRGAIGIDELKVQVSDGELRASAIVTIDNNLAFKGHIVSDSVDDVVVLLTGNGYLLRVKPDTSGEFKFYGLPDGDYAVKIRKNGYKSSVAKAFTLDITQVNQLNFDVIGNQKIKKSKSSVTSDNDFVLEALDSNNFSFHWEEDLSTAGYEYSTYINEPLIIEFLDEQLTVIDVSAANQLQHDFNIILVDSGNMKWTQEHAYRIAEMMKIIPQEQRYAYDFQSLAASKWQLTSDFIKDDIQITITGKNKTVIISDAIFINSVSEVESKRRLFYSQPLHHALNLFVTDNAPLTESYWESKPIPVYVFPGKIKRLDINVDGRPEEDKTVTIVIEVHPLEDSVKSASLRISSEIGTFTDVNLNPVDVNGDLLNNGEVSTILKGSFTLSKFAKGGLWRPQKIIITDFENIEHTGEANDFAWKLYVNNPLAKGLVFSENFDNQADWATTGRMTVGELPTNWDYARTDENWHPADGDVGTQPSMQINGNDLNQVYGDSGKAFITHSESYNDLSNNGFTSDGFITKDIPESNEIYLRFKVKFQAGWATNAEQGQIKMVRILHWDGPDSGTGERSKFFSYGNSAPIYIYDWSQNGYGVRQFHAFRCDKQETSYYCYSPGITDAPRQIMNGDMSANYMTNVERENVAIPDLVNGGILDYTSLNYHNQVWGDIWHTVGIHVKLNSAPGVQDGTYQYWLDGQKMMTLATVPWISVDGDMNAKWNSLSFGGNDRYWFNEDGVLSDRERWYAIDDIEVYNTLPEGL